MPGAVTGQWPRRWYPARRRTSPMIAASNASCVSWPSGCLDQAAVDEVVAAGDVGGPAGGQERDQRGDLFWGSEPAGGEAADPGDDRLAGGIGVYSGGPGYRRGHAVLAEPQVGGHRAGGDGVDADAVRAELLGEGLGQVDQRGLGGAVVDGGGVGLEEGIDGGDVDDRSAAVLDHLGQS